MVHLTRVAIGAAVLSVWLAGQVARAVEPVKDKLEYVPVKKIEVVETFVDKVTGGDVKEWSVFQIPPPVTPRQDITLKLEPGSQEGFSDPPDKTPLLFIRKVLPRLARDSDFTYKLVYAGNVCEVRLLPLAPGEAPPTVVPLTPAERKHYLARSKDVDFDSAEVKGWLDKEGLRRRRGESDLEFARRVFLSIRTTFTYKDPGPSARGSGTASQTAQARTGVCQGLTHLFAAAMRANGVPARCVDQFPVRMIGTFDRDAAGTLSHINSEFHAEGIGWVPCDVSNSAGAKTEAEALDYFGHDHAQFLALGPEEDLAVKRVVDMTTYGTREEARPADPNAKMTVTGTWYIRWVGNNPNGKEVDDLTVVVRTDPLVAERIDPTGEPVYDAFPGSFRIWRDTAGWHLRARGDKDLKPTFDVTVTAEGGKIDKYRHVGETKDMPGRAKITLKTLATEEVGFDFHPSADTKTLRFDLLHSDSGGGHGEELVFIGKDKVRPIQVPFLLDASAAAPEKSATPAKPDPSTASKGPGPSPVPTPAPTAAGLLELQIATSMDKPAEIVCQATNPGQSALPVKPFGGQGNLLAVTLPDGSAMTLGAPKDKIVEVPAGQTVTWRLDLSGYDQFSKPGTYKLVWKVGSQSSNTLVLTR